MTDPNASAPTAPTDAATPTLRNLLSNQSGTTTLEWALLMAAIALPSIVLLSMALNALVGYYTLMTTLNDLPFP